MDEEEEEEGVEFFFLGEVVVPFIFWVHKGAIGTFIILCSNDCISEPDPG